MEDFEEAEIPIMSAYDMLYRYAMYLSKDEDYAHDLLQETVLRIMANADKYKDQGKFHAWARTVMKRIYLNDQSSNERHKNKFIDGYDYLNDESTHPFVSENQYVYLKYDLHKAILMLPPRYSKIMVMILAGYKYEEIAKKMDMSIGYVKSTIFIAKNMLRRILNS